ncbi:MAG TPA: polysaccharide deacetylase family protein [Rhodanobacteraceae bacterium]
MTVYFTVDVEEDCPPFLNTWRGIEEGLPRLLDVLADEQVRATLFTTGEVARRYPDAVRSASAAGHELGCHSNAHGRYRSMSRQQADADVAAATTALRELAPVTSFRAPYLQFPREYVGLLADHGYAVDSSEGRHKRFGVSVHRECGVLRVPASVSSLTLRWPWSVRNALFAHLAEPIVLFCHPWEFVDLRHAPLRWDCRIGTGDRALASVRSAIRYFKAQGAAFGLMRDCVAA